MEIWKTIPGYEGYYQASDLGRIKSLDRIIVYSNGRKQFMKERIKKLVVGNHGYFVVVLYKNNKQKLYLVHRLILLTFIRKSNLHCNHKDFNRQNNNLDNLEYCTQKENVLHALRNGRMNEKKVNQLNLKGDFITTFSSEKEASKETGTCFSSISACLHNKYKTAGNFKWEFAR